MWTQQHMDILQELGRSFHEAIKLRLYCKRHPSSVCRPNVLGFLRGTCWAPRCQAAVWQGRALPITGIIAVCCQNGAVHEQAARAAPCGFVAPAVQQSRSCRWRKAMPVPAGSTQGDLLQTAAATGTFISAESHTLLRVTEELLASPGASFAAGPTQALHLVARNQRRAELPFTSQAHPSSEHWPLNKGKAITRASKIRSQIPKHGAGWMCTLADHHGPSPVCPSRRHFWPPG